MNVMDRPMFRAAGGGASKFPDLSGDGKVTQKDILIGRGVIEKQEGGGIGAMMPAGDMAMMPQEPLDPLAQDVLAAREQGEAIGLDYLAETMDGIDMAANTEKLINSIRGNDRPLEARVAELATFVGEADARQTPESVLTMVQPTIMMTEEGAIDSGVGGLIAQVIGDTEMEDDMGQGVGALMAQGQPEPMDQPVQQFNQGGAVKKFQTGTSPLGTRFPNTDPVFDPLFGTVMAKSEMMKDAESATGGLASIPFLADQDPDIAAALRSDALRQRDPVSAEQEAARFRALMEEAYDLEGAKAASDREAALDLARAGFAFASGRDPRTGENMAGRGFLAQLGSVGQQYAESAAERLARERRGEQALRLAAVQQGIAAEERDIGLREAEKSAARQTLFEDFVRGRGLQQQGKITAAGIKAQSSRLASQLGVDLFDKAQNRQFLEEQQERAAKNTQELARLNAELEEELAAKNFTRSKELREIIQGYEVEQIGINFNNNLALQADQIARLKDKDLSNRKLQGEIDAGLQTQRLEFSDYMQDKRQDFISGENSLDRDLKLEMQDNELDYREKLFELEEEKFALQKGLSPSTSDSWLFQVSGGAFGRASEAREIRDVEQEIRELRATAARQGIDLRSFTRADQDVQNYIALADQALRQETLNLRKSDALRNALMAAGAPREFGTQQQQFQLLGDNQLIKMYERGMDVPGFDLALTNIFGTTTLDNRGNPVPARKLTPTLRAALIKRKEAGFAIPSLPGFALGGEVDMVAGQGLLDPVTGYRFPMETPAQQPEQLSRTYEPIISRDIEDITKATGTREAIKVGFGNVANTVANVIFGTEFGVGADERQAKKAVETLGTVATTTLMAAIPGKDNVELQRMLKNLQVPADSLVLQDEEALDYFKLAKNTMALGIQNQEDLLDNANLTRKEITKVQTDLAQMNSIQAEYDNIIKAYEAKLKPSQQVFDELDKFFK